MKQYKYNKNNTKLNILITVFLCYNNSQNKNKYWPEKQHYCSLCLFKSSSCTHCHWSMITCDTINETWCNSNSGSFLYWKVNTIAARVYLNVQTVSIDSVSPEISEPNRRMCVLTLSDTYHHHTYIVYVKGTVESVEIQQREKERNKYTKKIRKQKYDN